MLGENGWLTRRLNYMKLCKKKLATGAVNVSIDNPIEEPLSNPECDLEWLKTHSIDKNDREGIVKKLNSTRELRKEMLKITETDLREQFSFFLVAPELVSIYHIQFKTCNLNFILNQLLWDYAEQFTTTSYNGFVDEWHRFGPVFREYCDISFDLSVKHTQWPDEIENILLLLKILPPAQQRGRGKGRKTVKPFLQLIQKMLVFRVVR